MKFKLKAADLNEALDVVSTVAPRALTPQGGGGYLFVVRGERCYLYSRDPQHVSRADFPITDVEGEGAFIYLAAHVNCFRLVGDEVTFETVQNDGVFSVRYSTSSGADGEYPTFDPRLMTACDKDLEAATNERLFHVGILREALSQARGVTAKPNDLRAEEHFKTVQIFDPSNENWAKGNGTLYTANGLQAFYFYCEAFEDKGLAVHGQHLPALTAFLSKCSGQVTVRTGTNMTFVQDARGRVLGWTHHTKTYPEYRYYQLKADKYIFAVPKGPLLDALKYVRFALEAKRDKVRMLFDAGDKTIRFQLADSNSKAQSFSIPVNVLTMEEEKSFAYGVNIDHFMDLITDVKGYTVNLHVAPVPPSDNRPKGSALFRTINEFLVDTEGKVVGDNIDNKPEGTFRCRVTRYVGAKD